MININKLKGKIVENEMSVAMLAHRLNIDRSTLYRKLGIDGDRLTVKEANAIVSILNLSTEEAISIFFNKKVAYKAKVYKHDSKQPN